MNRLLEKTIITIIVFVMAGFSVNAFAHGRWDGGRNHHGLRWHHGGEHHHSWSYMPCDYGKYGDRNNTDFEKRRNAFLKDTEQMRERLFNKEQLLAAELNKENPDETVAKNIQKEISEILAELNQKWTEHVIKMRKLNPNFNRRYGHMGGGYSGGGCWQ